MFQWMLYSLKYKNSIFYAEKETVGCGELNIMGSSFSQKAQ